MAAQQTRTSYLCPGVKPRSRNHELRPRGWLSVGNATGSSVWSVELVSDIVSNCSESRPRATSGSLMAGGATKTVFSVLAQALATSRANSAVQAVRRLMVWEEDSREAS